MTVTVAMTGASGNMGTETLDRLLATDCVGKIKILLLNQRKERRLAVRLRKRYGARVGVLFGNMKNKEDVRNLIEGAEYVLNLAAVIPPLADRFPKETEECNVLGVKNMVECIEEIQTNQPKLVHISSVAVYGNRNYLHPWGRVGDPVMSGVYDGYSATKIKGERFVLDSEIRQWVILRQTGILHKHMLTDNMKDGLMFHTCYNTPIEWVTDCDSGVLIEHLIEKDCEGALNGEFWKKCYNIGGGAKNRITGYDTFSQGFEIIGGSTEKFMSPQWNSIRNFHCMWFSDSALLNEYLDFQSESVGDYWVRMARTHKYFALAKILPPQWISKIAIQRLLRDKNAPRYWIEKQETGRIKAFFGSKDNIDCLPIAWEKYPILAHGQIPDGSVDYEAMKDESKIRENGYVLSHGYDESKNNDELNLADMQSAAAFRGGKCLSEDMKTGDLYTKLEWECHDEHRFLASPYCVLKAGHWCPTCCQPQPWDYDRLSKFMPFYAQIWYDTHAKEENSTYYFDRDGHAKYTVYEK